MQRSFGERIVGGLGARLGHELEAVCPDGFPRSPDDTFSPAEPANLKQELGDVFKEENEGIPLIPTEQYRISE